MFTPMQVGNLKLANRIVLLGVRRWSDMPIEIQLNHAGRKASLPATL
jgi:2,4-dienoyl-CoA reductase-like NADH-dependent reductase (Old Yellow Enzyme family)